MKKLTLVICIMAIIANNLPVASALYGDEPEISCKSAILYEVHSQQVLYTKEASQKAYPSSLAKIMTALIAVENCDITEMVEATKSALNSVPKYSSIAGLKAGEILTMEDLLECLLVPSGNDAANVIAEHVAGSVENFVVLMNKRAAELGCKNTNFVNPSGFHDDEQYSTAEDLLVITIEAMKYPIINDICSKSQASVPANDVVKVERIFNNTNYMISRHITSEYYYEPVTGLKTGSTAQAGQCLICTAKDKDIHLVCIVLGGEKIESEDGTAKIMSYVDTKALLKWAFNNFSYKEVLKISDVITEVKVELAEDKDYVVLVPEKSISDLLHDETSYAEFERTVKVNENVTAPINKGDKLGTVTVSYGSKVYEPVNLIALNGVSRSEILYYIEQAEIFLSNKRVKTVISCIVIFIILFIIYMIIYNKVRRRRVRKVRRRR